MDIICNICNTKISNKRDITKHQKTEKCQNIKKFNELININKNYEIEFNKHKEIIENLNNDIKFLNINFKNELLEKDSIILKLKEQIKSIDEKFNIIKEKSEEYRKIVEKAAVKSTKTVNNNTYNRNNYLNYISKEPIKFSELQQNISKLVTAKTIMLDNDDFNEHITKNMFKDENGKDKVICTDINRKNFTYKDEKSGQLISDPELERLREQLIKGSNSKMIKKNLLDKLIKKYEGTNIDPYNKFYEYLQNIQFGTPFIEHVAKKTYIKTKSNSNKNINTIDQEEDNEYEECEDDDDFEKIDKLYHQLKEEFEDIE